MRHTLVTSLDQLHELLEPILRGDVAGGEVAVDTETSEIVDGRFTPYGTDSWVCGFSVSYDLPLRFKLEEPAAATFARDRRVDFYVPVRHQPYGWKRRPELLRQADRKYGSTWFRRLTEDEGILPCPDGQTGPEGWVAGWDPNVDPAGAFALLVEAMAAPGVKWWAHNWGFDGPMLDVEGVRIPWDRIQETQFLSIQTDPRPLDKWDEESERFLHGGHALKHLGETWLGVAPDAQALLKQALEAMQIKDYSQLPLRTILAPYACMDTRLTLDLARHCRKRETWTPGAQAIYETERKLIRHVVGMMRRGLLVRRELAEELRGKAEDSLQEVALRGNRAAARINPGVLALAYTSPEKLTVQLFDELGMPYYRRKRDTKKATLKMMRKRCEGQHAEDQREVLDAINEHRGLHKEITSFYRPLTRFADPDESRIYPIVRQQAAVTTRMSGSKPNMMQQKKQGEVRRVFQPTEGCGFGFTDYNQIELRIAAHYSKAMPSRFESVFTWPCTLAKRGDCKGREEHGPADSPEKCRKVIHVGRKAWKQKPTRLYLYDGFLAGDPGFDPHQRQADAAHCDRDTAKTVNFACLYGAYPWKIAETLDCDYDTARELWTTFWERAYPELGYARDILQEIFRHHGPATKHSHREYIRTLKGARVHLAGPRLALNYLVQRSAREVFGEGVVRACEWLEQIGAADDYWPVQPIHDEVVWEYRLGSFDVEVWRGITQQMQAAGTECLVPLTVGCELGENSWAKNERETVNLEVEA